MSSTNLILPPDKVFPSQPAGRYKWWQAALVGVIANVISAAPAGYNGEEVFYNQSLKPAISPPDWAFAPVWLFNNVASLYAGLLIANLPKGTPGRKTALVLEATGWGLFAAFSPVYFGLKSPVLGAVNTVAGLGVAAAVLRLILKLLYDDIKYTLTLGSIGLLTDDSLLLFTLFYHSVTLCCNRMVA